MIKSKLDRIDLSLVNCLDEIGNERVKRNIDKKTQSLRRLTKAVANLLSTDTNIRERLINAIIEDDRRIYEK